MDAPLFSQLRLSGWRQFRHVEIDFHNRLTILTGANGAGKSTILKLLKCHFKYETDENFLATPVKDSGRTTFSLGSWVSTQWDKLFTREKPGFDEEIGSISYTDGGTTLLQLPRDNSMQYAVKRTKSVEVAGISIASHRPAPKYNEVKSISISGLQPVQAYKEFFDINRSYMEQQNYIVEGAPRRVNPVYAIKQAIISFATFGVGNINVAPVPELEGLYDKFQEILRNVLPKEIGFQRLEIRTPEVVIVSSSGEFPIDGASGGMMSIIELSWQIFLQSEIHGSESYMVLIDEPENHLHPSMQRTFLSNVVNAFPQARFVVATHSPFIISSVRDSYVYALRHHTADGSALLPVEPRSVDSTRLDTLQKAGPANEILREVLGVPLTLPDWSAAELERITADFANSELSSQALTQLRQRLEAVGLSEFFPTAVERIVK